MCRFIVYKGSEPIQMSHLVTRPRHSIINQAFESKLRFPSSRPMNADGFGIGWYDPLPPLATQVAESPHGVPSSGPITPASPARPSKAEQKANGTDHVPNQPVGGEPTSPGVPQAEDRMRGPATPGVVEQHLSLSQPALDDEGRAEQLRLQVMRADEREVENERPCVFKSISPAWSNANLTRLAEKIRSPLVFAHVRASTMPGAPSEDNCHPWIFGRLMWMHNGELSNFSKIKRKLQQSLPEELFLYPSGYTDSEWVFMVFLSKLKDPKARSFTHVELRDAMMETLRFVNRLSKEAGITTPHLLNYVVSDGETVVAIRYISSRTSEASSLFFSSGTSFDEYQDGGLYRMTRADKRENIIMIASEPLTFEPSDWMEVKTNTMLVITPKMNLLQIPIRDEYWVEPQDPEAGARSTDFAISMGFGHGFASMNGGQDLLTAQ